MTSLVDAAPRPSPATPSRAALDGIRDITPMVIGVLPFGLAIGASIATSSLSTAAGVATGPGILAGAAQLSTVELLSAGAGPAVVILSALMINARILLYSASLAPWFADEPLGRRLLLAVPVIDQLHFTCVPRFERGDLDARGRRWYYAGAAVWLAGSWTASQAIAIVAGARLPDWLGLHVAAPLALVGLLAKSVAGRRAVTAALAAATTVPLAVDLPLQSAVLVATVVGLLAGSSARRADVDGEESS